MANATIKTRIQLKNDTEANWRRALHFSPMRGEIIIYSPDDSHPFSRLKVGDGTTNVNDLPFVESDASIKADSTEGWGRKPDFVPKFGELVIYTDKTQQEGQNIPGIKVGDGNAFLVDLPFMGEDIKIQFENHLDDASIHTTAAEKALWNNKITCDDEVMGEELILTRN